ncbi:heavy metal-associated isoprenylated plant protein 7-like [Cornus florida]|uniref:heavy metal-associated isoprenylated plant protein 7-like n=1 Tax=Cornus florida TaxID=4283 RepID=UPI002897B8B5|nr:heavy metal-associated isoprenylated plant protein 7-like [Cornus florida]
MGKRNNKINPPAQNSEEASNAENEESKKTQNTKGVIVLGVYIHCEGCADKVIKSLRGFDGVEEIEIDSKNHKVTVKGKNADPTKVAERLRKKTKKHVELISPIIKEKKEEKKEKKEEPPKVVEVVLKVFMHCDGCAQDVKYRIHKMQGVHTVETDMAKAQVTVKGVFDSQKLVDYIHKRAGKRAVIVKQAAPAKKEDVKKDGKKEGDKEEKTDSYNNFPPGLVYAPQLFSDENPNACSIM